MKKIISILIVFIVLSLIIIVTSLFSKIIISIEKKKRINPKVENKLLDEDEDAVVATIVASMDFYNETKKHARLVSITRTKGE